MSSVPEYYPDILGSAMNQYRHGKSDAEVRYFLQNNPHYRSASPALLRQAQRQAKANVQAATRANASASAGGSAAGTQLCRLFGGSCSPSAIIGIRFRYSITEQNGDVKWQTVLHNFTGADTIAGAIAWLINTVQSNLDTFVARNSPKGTLNTDSVEIYAVYQGGF